MKKAKTQKHKAKKAYKYNLLWAIMKYTWAFNEFDKGSISIEKYQGAGSYLRAAIDERGL